MIPYADQLKFCSDFFQDGMEKLQREGEPYYGDRAHELARRAIMLNVPDITKLLQADVRAVAALGVALEGDTSYSHHGLEVRATLDNIRIQELHEFVGEGEEQIGLTRHDLCIRFVPQFREPDPVDIVFAQELFVPFSDFALLEPAE